MPTPAYTAPGGNTTPASSTTADVSALVRNAWDGSLTGTPGLNTQTIPTFASFGAMVAAYPSPTAGNTPPLVRVWNTGDTFSTLYFYNQTASAWTAFAGFAGMESATTSSSIAALVNPGDTLGLLSVTVPAATAQRLVTVSWSALVNFNSTADSVELILRVNGSAVRQAIRSAPAALVSTIEGASYSFFVNPGAGFSLQTLYQKRAGTGPCTTSTDPRYTTLQYVSQFL